ncbi:hypothetical protein HPB49_006689 [Dermacentor silvarum]|uniref:Uncharacterized protein n=1 Tax=Dermacentor silvarum TaxID=543639 RepID=A0ACB8CW91_DERSI|nr:hypothetical protein HPB49_006689 [Dermacentor silvarum]
MSMDDRTRSMRTLRLEKIRRGGVIHGIEPRAPSDVLRPNLRIRTQGLELIDARMLGDSQSALLTLYGSQVPRHRTDVCPQPDIQVCRTCGVREPADGQACAPKCAICGGNHPTGDRTCPKRLKPVKARSTPQSKKTTKTKLRWFASEDEDSELGFRPRTDHRSRSRTRSPSWSRAWSGQPGQRKRSASRPKVPLQHQQPTSKTETHRSKSPGAPLAWSTSQYHQEVGKHKQKLKGYELYAHPDHPQVASFAKKDVAISVQYSGEGKLSSIR